VHADRATVQPGLLERGPDPDRLPPDLIGRLRRLDFGRHDFGRRDLGSNAAAAPSARLRRRIS
jgi:hypothetical protein